MTRPFKDELTRRGFAFVRNFRLSADTITIANELGTPLIPWEHGLIQGLAPRASSTPNTFSGIYGLNRYPFHTDLAHWSTPPRYLLLRCTTGYADVSTPLIDGRILIEALTL